MEIKTYLLLIAAFVPAAAQSPGNPPRAGSLAPRALALPGYHWVHRRTPHAEIYVRGGSSAEKIIASLPANVERAVTADLARLGVPFSGPRLRLFFVGSRDEMRPLVGAMPGGHAATDEGAGFLIGNDSIQPAMRHEIMHLLSWRLWGTPSTAWFSEGLATSAAGKCGGKYSVHQVAAVLARENRLVPLDTLWKHFIYSAETGATYYIEGASLVEYIERRFGHDGLRALWPIGAYDDVDRRLGINRATLERDWRASLPPAPTSGWAEIFTNITRRGCE